MISAAGAAGRDFSFAHDTFAFANELLWEYRFDPATGKMATARNRPPPRYAHRCFVMVRTARQFFYHARFAPDQAAVDEATYRRLVRAVVRRSPRQPCLPDDRIVIPGQPDLRTFSGAQARVLRAECGGAWQSYCLRSHWRMVFPISRRHQARTADQLAAALTVRPAPIVHLVRFPQLTINHGLLVFAHETTATGVQFRAYDPNAPAQPATLTFERAQRTFFFPRNSYWPGGPLNVIEVYRGWLY